MPVRASVEAWIRGRLPRGSRARRRLAAVGSTLKRLRRSWRTPVARVLAVLLPASVLRDARFFGLWERRGLHVVRRHFYSPVPDSDTLATYDFERETSPAGLDWRESDQLDLLAKFESTFRDEYARFPRERGEVEHEFTLANSSFGPVDAEILYCMIRHHRPAVILEIGSGHSTRLAAQAARANGAAGHATELIAIEPYPDRVLRRGIPGVTHVIAAPAQEVPLEEFERLRANDILFIDSSHVVKTGSDVQYEFLEILPRLQPGVLIHVHDIYLPREYPRRWVLEGRTFFNEQYLLQAFLSFNASFAVVWAGHYMHLRHPERLREAFPSYAGEPPVDTVSSFWMRRT